MKLVMLLSNESLAIEKLENKISFTKKTILADITAFNYSYAPAFIDSSNLQSITLTIPNELNVETIVLSILRHSVHIKILVTIFIEEPTIDRLAKQFYLSKSSIRRMINHINDYFFVQELPFAIQLSSKLQIKGEESQIRHYFCSIFRKLYEPTQLPDFHILFVVVKRYLKKYGMFEKTSTYELIYFVFFLFTTIIRSGNNHHAIEKMSSNVGYSHAVSVFFDILKKNTVFCSAMQKSYQFSVTEHTVTDLLCDLPLAFFCESSSSKQEDTRKLNVLVDRFYTSMGVNASLTSEQLQELNFFIGINKKKSQFKTSYVKNFFVLLLKNYPSIVSYYEQALVYAAFDSVLENKRLYEELLLELIIVSPELLNQVIPRPKKYTILILSYQEKKTCSLYKQWLNKKYPSLTTIDTYQKSILDLDYSLINQYDLVLSEVGLDQKKLTTDYIKISKFPTPSFWKNIESILLME
ncbi:helix-turn-helix domain-containing protein [Enterococcus sp. ZJ1668]|uniref:helix-turn-helix domain-containing protein n=1 Tax=Enterococcus sp. ZJ1668 TaxID=2709402 RepID=UPI0013ED3D17|nr:helix-turn-helix domain-containing protein [Enterococcus sp. ZJ1668]